MINKAFVNDLITNRFIKDDLWENKAELQQAG